MDVYDAIVDQEVPAVEGRTAEFNDLIRKCLTKNRAQRPTVAELLNHPFLEGAESHK